MERLLTLARRGQELGDLVAEAETSQQPRQNQSSSAPQTNNHEIAGDEAAFFGR